MKRTFITIGIGCSIVAVFVWGITTEKTYSFSADDPAVVGDITQEEQTVPEATEEALAGVAEAVTDDGRTPSQKQLSTSPATIKAIYATAWTTGSPDRRAALVELIKETEVNAIVIDIKDYSGHVLYDSDIPAVADYGAREPRIRDLNGVIKQFHDAGIYVIARLTNFQDPVLAEAHPEWAVQSGSTGKVWKDNKGLAWMDPACEAVWEYNISIAKEAASRGIDEINFDYIRFPSDGSLGTMTFPCYDEATEEMHKTMGRYFAYADTEMEGTFISADLFGLATVNRGDLGIGQVIEDAYKHFDYVAPMVYPSHYAAGFAGYSSPAAHPYEVVKASLQPAFIRLFAVRKGMYPRLGQLRPWLQDFDLGADYDAAKVKAQMQAIPDALCDALREDQRTNGEATGTSCDVLLEDNHTRYANGWMLWSPSNVYTRGALGPSE